MVARSLFAMGWSLASTLAKLKRCHQMPMPGTAAPHVEMTCLQGLADLERLESPWLDGLATGDPETVAITLRLLLAHMACTSKRLMGAMVLDRLDVELATTRLDAHGMGNSTGCPHGCPQTTEY